jgi:hypothetical protein
MAKDMGPAAGAVPYPARVGKSSGVRIKVTDPLNGGVGYAYLFRRSGSLNPSAGRRYVNYTFRLASGAYPATYRFAAGNNTESSTVVTPSYSRAFTDRWKESGLGIGPSGLDILDRNEDQFTPDYCGRSTATFAGGEGTFLANRSGPVRAIRAFMGANSGPMTERQQVFYAGREDDTINLRVHPIPSVLSFLDYSAAASGMTYRNNNNTAGVTIDGVPDSVTPGALTWESVDGSQGALTSVHTWSSTLAASKFTSFYRDQANPPSAPCQGDARFYGASGPWINGSIGSTNEPADGSAPADRLTTTRTMFFGPAGTSDGALRHSQVTAPLRTSSAPVRSRVRLSLGLRYRRARGCSRWAAVLTVKGSGLGQVRRAGLRVRSRSLGTDRSRPFRVAFTRKRMRGHARGVVVVRARLAGGGLVTLKRRVRGLC